MNTTPRSNRLHIAFFGQTNAGKSSLINALTGQDIALVSDIKGTTTDPVYKAMEILPIGPVVLIDTAGLNDDTRLGILRQKKTIDVLEKTDVALLVFDANQTPHQVDVDLISAIKKRNIPCIGILNKIDDMPESSATSEQALKDYATQFDIPFVATSARTKQGIDSIKDILIKHSPQDIHEHKLVGDLIQPGDFVVLVTPVDSAAPKGRVILPQQQTVRDIIDHDAMAIVTKETEFAETLRKLGTKPALVITDSQAFEQVSAETPLDIPLTSFSILFARHKGDLNSLIQGASTIDRLQDGDKVLIAEGCTHHRQADDIGTVKIPRWLRQSTGKDLIFEHTAGVGFKDNLDGYKLVIHCGGCMLNHKAMNHRITSSLEENIPIVNYGVLIAYIHGILDRALDPFAQAKMIWDESK
jgi:[FeFe] hydrogenase H-cluster maturation GTPase HydF